jgi:hypothetical protein
VIARIEEILKHDVAGDPCTGLKWTRRATRKIAKELRALGIAVSARTVARLLEDMDFSLRVNRKSISRSSHADRNEQFLYISQQRMSFIYGVIFRLDCISYRYYVNCAEFMSPNCTGSRRETSGEVS